MATLIPVEGPVTLVQPANAKTGFSLKELYALLGCSVVQVVELDDGDMMIVDEEGKLTRKPLNCAATGVAYGSLLPGDYIVGSALVVRQQEFQ